MTTGLESTATPQLQGGLLEALDVSFDEAGIARLRDGDEALSMVRVDTVGDELVDASAHAVWHRGEELCLVDGKGGLQSWNRCEEGWRRAGNWTPGRLRQDAVLPNASGFRQVDAQTLGECTLVVGSGDGKVYFAVVTADGRTVVGPSLVDAIGQDIRCCKAADWVLVVYTAGNQAAPGTKVFLARWDLSAVDQLVPLGSISPAFHLMPALPFPPLYDVRRVPGTNRVAVLCAETLSSLNVREVDRTGAFFGGGSYAMGASDIRAVSIWPTGTLYRVAWWDVGSQTVDSALLNVGGTIAEQAAAAAIVPGGYAFDDAYAVTVAAAPTVAEPTRALVCATSRLSQGGRFYFRLDVWATAGAAMALVRTWWHTTLQSHAWLRNGDMLIAVAYQAEETFSPWVVRRQLLNHAHLVLAPATGEVVGRAMRGYAVVKSLEEQDPVCPDENGDVVNIVAPRQDAAFSTGIVVDAARDSTYLLRLDFTRRAQAPAVFDRVATVAHAGAMRAYDGETAAEADWHVSPDIELVVGQAGGSLTALAAYTLAVTWEWTNRHGDLYRSEPALVSYTLGAGEDRIALTVRTLQHTERTNVRIVVWRSLGNVAAVLYPESEVVNDPSVATVTVLVSRSDVDAEAGGEALDQLPGLGAALPHDPTPGTDFVALAQGRLWTRDPERGYLVRHSLPRREGYGTGWSSTQVVEPSVEADVTSVAEQDGQILLFNEQGATVIVGQGPEANGEGQAFSIPQRIPLESGAEVHEAVVAIAGGVAYWSSGSEPQILVRTRGGADLGGAVERLFVADGQRVVMASYDSMTGELHMLDDGAEGGRRGTLRLHLGTGRWARDTGRQGRDMSISPGGEMVVLRLDGTVIRRVVGRYLDPDGSPMRFIVRTPWLRSSDSTVHPIFDAVHGQVTGNWIGAHELQVAFYRDYSDIAALEARSVLTTEPADYVYRQRWAFGNSGCRAFSVEWRMVATTSRGAEFVAIDAELRPTGDTGALTPAQEDFEPLP